MHKAVSIALVSFLLLFGACSTPSFGGFSLIGGASNAEQSKAGNNDRMVYLASGAADEVCASQASLITQAGYTASGEMRKETGYTTGSFTKGAANLTLMCSEEDNGQVKVTLTLQGGK